MTTKATGDLHANSVGSHHYRTPESDGSQAGVGTPVVAAWSALAPPHDLRGGKLNALQRTVGNHAVGRMLAAGGPAQSSAGTVRGPAVALPPIVGRPAIGGPDPQRWSGPALMHPARIAGDATVRRMPIGTITLGATPTPLPDLIAHLAARIDRIQKKIATLDVAPLPGQSVSASRFEVPGYDRALRIPLSQLLNRLQDLRAQATTYQPGATAISSYPPRPQPPQSPQEYAATLLDQANFAIAAYDQERRAIRLPKILVVYDANAKDKAASQWYQLARKFGKPAPGGAPDDFCFLGEHIEVHPIRSHREIGILIGKFMGTHQRLDQIMVEGHGCQGAFCTGAGHKADWYSEKTLTKNAVNPAFDEDPTAKDPDAPKGQTTGGRGYGKVIREQGKKVGLPGATPENAPVVLLTGCNLAYDKDTSLLEALSRHAFPNCLVVGTKGYLKLAQMGKYKRQVATIESSGGYQTPRPSLVMVFFRGREIDFDEYFGNPNLDVTQPALELTRENAMIASLTAPDLEGADAQTRSDILAPKNPAPAPTVIPE